MFSHSGWHRYRYNDSPGVFPPPECFGSWPTPKTSRWWKHFVPICLYCLNYTQFGQLIIRKIIKIIATRCQILRLKCTKFRFRREGRGREETEEGRGKGTEGMRGRERTWMGCGEKGKVKEAWREREERGYIPRMSIPGAATVKIPQILETLGPAPS